MKKLLLNVLACSAILFSVISCGGNPEPKHVAKVVDYRNKDASGNAITRSAASAGTVEFSYEFKDFLENFSGNKGKTYSYVSCNNQGFSSGEEYEKMKNAIKFEDCEDGVKLVFTKPADYDNVTWIVFQYIDGYGNRSTAMECADWGALFETGDFEFVYPLVCAGQKATFWVMLGNGKDEQPSTSFFYDVMPAHGEKVVDDMQEDYEETDYIEIVDGHVMNLKMTIPPSAKDLTYSVTLAEQDGGTKAWENEKEVNKLGQLYLMPAGEDAEEAAENGEEYELTVDLKNYITPGSNAQGFDTDLSKDYEKIFVEFVYRYKLEDFPGYYFATPAVKPVPVDNVYFKKTPADE